MKNNIESLISVDELSRVIGLTPYTVRLKCRRREIPCYKIGGVYKFKMSEIEEWLESKRRKVVEMASIRVSKKLFC